MCYYVLLFLIAIFDITSIKSISLLNFLPVILLVANIIGRYQMPRSIVTVVVSSCHFSCFFLTALINKRARSIHKTTRKGNIPWFLWSKSKTCRCQLIHPGIKKEIPSRFRLLLRISFLGSNRSSFYPRCLFLENPTRISY